MQKNLGIIPARYASSRFPGKPLADIQGKPMIQWVYERCRESFDHLVVATDDYRIISAVHHFGGEALLTSDTHASGTDRCYEAYCIVKKQEEESFDVVANIQGDEPMVSPAQIEALTACFKREEVKIATLIQPFAAGEDPENRNIVKVTTDQGGKALAFSRSPIPIKQGAPEAVYYKHIGMYAFRSEVLERIQGLSQTAGEIAEKLEQLRWLEHGYSIHTAVTEHISVGVDSPEDLDKVRTLLRGK